MLFIKVDPTGIILESINSEYKAVPPGFIQLTESQAQQINNSEIGFSAFTYVFGVLIPNQRVEDDRNLSSLRKKKIDQIISRRNASIRETIQALGNVIAQELMIELWPMLDTTQASVDILLCRDIYIYAKSKITQAETATLAQLNAYNPATDPNWP